jgi:polysaccharide biosynthesis protein PslG
MARHLRRPIVAFALGLCLAAWPSQAANARRIPSAHPASVAPMGGVNVEGLGLDSTPAEADRTMAGAHAVGAKLVRTEVVWSLLEPQGPTHMNLHALAYVDRLVSDAEKYGIRVIMTVDYTPCWASSAPATMRRGCSPWRTSEANRWPPAHPADYAAVAAFLAQRYASNLAAIEVWNEPDQANEDYFAGPHKAARYGAILRAAYPAVKQVAPNVTVLAGSLVGYDGVFLRSLYAAGIKGYYDGIAVHFYSLTLASLRSFRSVELANGDRTPLWLDEFGWSSCYPRMRIQDEQACVTSQVQARNITSLYRELNGTSYVAAMTLYELKDGSNSNFGVLSARNTRKPSFGALAGVFASPVGPPPAVTLSLRREGANVLASGTGPVGDFMQMEVHRGATLRFKATFTLNRFDGYKIKLPAALGTSSLRVRVYQEWLGPSRGAQKSV